MCKMCGLNAELVKKRRICKSCYNELRKSYPSYKHIGRNRKKGYTSPSKAEKKAVLDSIRDVPCLDCGGRFPPCAMDFDHVDKKSFGIMGSYARRSMQQILEEIDKCEIVCANCHRVRTASRRG